MMIYKRKNSQELAQKGWLGIGDKYWITSIDSTKRIKNSKQHLDYKNKYRAKLYYDLNPL